MSRRSVVKAKASKYAPEIKREMLKYGVHELVVLNLTDKKILDACEVARAKVQPMWHPGCNPEEFQARIIAAALDELGVPDPEVDVP